METEKPILFTAAMVRAILNRKKTQTRRVIKFKDGIVPWYCYGSILESTDRNRKPGDFIFGNQLDPVLSYPTFYSRPKYLPGYILWVKETFQAVHITGDPDDFLYANNIPKSPHLEPWKNYWTPIYEAAGDWDKSVEDRGFPWRPSIYMPKWASRIRLKITKVRAERVQSITNADAFAEGSTKRFNSFIKTDCFNMDWSDLRYFSKSPVESFRCYWNKINTKRGYGWETNPWVWVYEFEVLNEN
jgi:hypothetical protein